MMKLTRRREADGIYAVERGGVTVARIRRDTDGAAPSTAIWEWELVGDAVALTGRPDGWQPTLRDAVRAVARALGPVDNSTP